MASEVYEDALDLTIGLLEAVPPAADAADSSYPLPSLRSLDRTEVRTFRAIVLENPFLRVTVLPDLGGRIFSVFDKRFGVDLLPKPRALLPTPGGPRGLHLPVGIELRLNGDFRPNAMGPVAFALEPPSDEDDSAALWVAETSMHGGLAFHQRIALPADRAELRIEARVHNRTLASVRYHGQLALHVGGTPAWKGAALLASEHAWVATGEDGTLLDGLAGEGGTALIGRTSHPVALTPRFVDTWSLRLTPYPGLGDLTAANGEVAARLSDAALDILTVSDRAAHKLVLLTEDGQTLEAPADLRAERPLSIPLGDLPSHPRVVVVLDAERNEILHVDRAAPPPANSTPVPETTASIEVDPRSPEDELRRMSMDPMRRPVAQVALAMRAIARRDLEEADRRLEQALLYNGDDPLAWWAKAAVRRLQDATEEPVERLNAHYLSPLEPALRAEAFLSQSPAMGHEPSPLVAPVAEIPDDLVEVASLLIEHGFLDQAHRWIDEALRHHDLAMLRYLMADVLLRGTRLDAEAAEHVRAAARAMVPPLPWRPIERRALANVAARFPDDAAVRRLLALADGSLTKQ